MTKEPKKSIWTQTQRYIHMQRNSIKTQNQKLWYQSENACVCGGVIAQDKALWEKIKTNLQKYQWLTFCWAWDLALGMVYSPSKTPLKKHFFFSISNRYHLEVVSGLGGMDVISKRQLIQSTSKRKNILITKTRRQKLFIILLTFLSDNSVEETSDVSIHFLYSY